jgi:hypothetical protein
VARTLAALPWVEPETIAASRKTRQVKFTVKDRAAFDPEEVKKTIRAAGYPRAAVLAGPTDS